MVVILSPRRRSSARARGDRSRTFAATPESRPPVRDRFSVLGPEIVWWYRARCLLVRQRGQLGTSFRKSATLFAVFALQASRSTAPARPTGIPAISGISGRTFATRRPRNMRRACSSAWRRWRGARSTGNGLPRSSRCSPMCGTTNDWIASRCPAAAKSTASNCSLVWCGVTHEARGVRAVANALIARMAMHYRSFMSNRMTARCFCATRDLHHRCVQAFCTATTFAFCCRTF